MKRWQIKPDGLAQVQNLNPLLRLIHIWLLSSAAQKMDSKFEGQKKTTTVDSLKVSRDIATVEIAGWDIKATKRLLWKLDLNIVPFMSLIYLFVSSPPPRMQHFPDERDD